MSSKHCIFLLILAVTACGGDATTGVGVDVPADVALDFGGPDFPSLDIVSEDAAPDSVEPAPDAVPDLGGPACAPGEGCFLDPCAENTDCQSGWCVEHMGDGVCTQPCTEECPDGWICKAVAGTDPDLVYVCVSDHANLCKPCADAAGCVSPAGTDDACVDYGDEGAFCGGTCDPVKQPCPWGFTCVDAQTVDGFPVTTCLADAGVCPCTDKSVALALWTPCAVENDFGLCAGKRVCTEDGLSDCDAALPMEEICNGQDDDCDGEADEPTLVEGDYVPLCEDDNPCTDDACMGADGCDHLAMDTGECMDGDACTVGDHCEAGTCVGLPVVCDDDDPCTLDLCDGLGGCTTEPAQGPCDDGDPCTVGDLCQDGGCAGTPVDCQCMEDEDCAALEDGDLCNGTLLCDTTSLPYQCAVDEDTVVVCPEAPAGADAICLQALCDPGTGACSLAPDHEGAACDDGDLCTAGDHCTAGACESGAFLPCDDGDLCTDDVCDPSSGCLFTPNAAACDDGNACTTGDLCQGGWCKGIALLDCDDQDPCTDDSCAMETGCVHSLNSAACDDGNLCTTGDHCHLGTCIPGGTLPCDDQNPCTDDSCHALLGCQFSANSDPCDDGNDCTEGDHCAGGWCVPETITTCDDGDPCTDDACDPLSGCTHVANDAACDDGDACTTADQCSGGSCVGGPGLVCDDGDGCTDDACDPLSGCTFTPNFAVCDDGDACTTADQCSGGSCVGGPGLVCDDSNPCTTDSCLQASGCDFGAVVDGTPCPGGTCQAGVCQPSATGKIVFVGSQKHSGNFGGITGADAYCQGLASAAGLPGTFRAWLSAGSYASSPAARFNKSSEPYVLVDGTTIANNWADLTDGSILHPINVDETGGAASTSMVYSFTRIDGTQGLFESTSEDCYGGDCHCNGWTTTATGGSPTPGSAVGQTAKSNDDWTDYSFGNFCGGSYPLYCFQQ